MKATPFALRTIIVLLAAVVVFTTAGCGGGGGGGSSDSVSLGGAGGVSQPTSSDFVGTEVCTGCHAKFPFSNGFAAGDPTDTNPTSPTFYDANANTSIPINYSSSVHNATPTVKSDGVVAARDTGSDVVQCEGCHGPGRQHFGVGPIPFYQPAVAQCENCHGGTSLRTASIINLTEFNATAHANAAGLPDAFFYQGGTSTAQATIGQESGLSGTAEWKDAGLTTPVSMNEHIEECSVCHSPTQKAAHIAKGDTQSPPQVSCNGCHDPHRPADTIRNYVPARDGSGLSPVAPEYVVNLKPYKVNNNGAAAMFGAQNVTGGTWIRPRLWYAYNQGGAGGTTYAGYTITSNVVSSGKTYAVQGSFDTDSLRLSPERLCASCHTKGTYKYGVASSGGSLPSTHQGDVFTQYKLSAHGDINDEPWKAFSQLGPASDVGHRPVYPIDMGGLPGEDGNKVALSGNLNPGTKANNVYECFQCHNGIGTIAYLEGTVGSVALGDRATVGDAPIVWGDSNVTCITCHDTHANGASTTKNVRVPKLMSYGSGGEFKPWTAPNGGGNTRGGVAGKFLDLTPLPTDLGNNVICIFCHQGRESGWTEWNKIRNARNNDPNFLYTNPDTVISPTSVVGQPPKLTGGFAFINDHYLAAGSLLYGRNSGETLGQTYTDGIPDHQTKGCVGCHMAPATSDNSAGGHTWKPNISTCNECHKGVVNFHGILASADWDGDGVTGTVYDEIGTLTKIAAGTATPVYGTLSGGLPIGGTGLIGRLNEALYDAGTRYDPDTYPYFYYREQVAPRGNTVAFKDWTPAMLTAAQNLQQLYKTGAAADLQDPNNHQALYVHNPYYAAQILIDALALVGKTSNPTTHNLFATNRPSKATYNSGGSTHSGRDYRLLTP